MTLNFVKMNAHGNDFIVIDGRYGNIELSKEEIIALSDYKRSVGFDQLLLIENSLEAHIKMRIFNRDGLEVSACGNGTRCVAKLYLEENKTNKVTIATLERIITATSLGNQIKVNMGKAKITQKNIEFDAVKGDLVEIGNPHIVVLDYKGDYKKLGPIIESDKRFPNRVNVDFAKVIKDDEVELKVWERGCGATEACGTAACATFFLLYNKGLIKKEVTIKQPGGNLNISLVNDDIFMAGEANINYRGFI